jgi:mono/diheme cytochrome c family protein
VGLGLLAIAFFTTGCWEQVSKSWFEQMKEQPAVQALEGTQVVQGTLLPTRPLAPPPGTIPLGGIEPRIDSPVPAFMPEAMGLQNPIKATPESVERGKYVFDIYCATCHGADGMANLETTPVAKRLAFRGEQQRPPGEGMTPPPLQAVPAYTDGFLFTKIRYGKPQMPGYPQIPAEDRWHVVNYLRTLIKGS